MTAIEEVAKRLHFLDGGRARLFLYPKALPCRVPDYLWYLVHVEEAVVKGGLQECAYLPRAAQYDLELSPGWNLVTWSTTSPRTLGSTGPGCTVGRRPTGRSGPGRAGGALGPRS
jgi:hypothetical protein